MNTQSHQTRIPTNWHVITGAPCSGKTAVIDRLEGLGYRTEPEVARAYIDHQLALGKTLAGIKADIVAFERCILLEKMAIESRLPKDQMIFLDRAVPDSIAYYQLEGLDPDEPVKQSLRMCYCKIFLFDALQFEKDSVRTENQALSNRIEDLLIKAYTALGYKIVRVPVMGVDQRVEFVLSRSGTLPKNP